MTPRKKIPWRRQVGHAWQTLAAGFWDRAPRQLTVTTEGKVLVFIAFALGGAAINTGHNLLYLGWGLVLSAIVLSGLLSEATLQAVFPVASRPEAARVGLPAPIPLKLENPTRYLPAFAVDVDVPLSTPHGEAMAKAPLLLRLSSGEGRAVFATFTPLHRGRHEIRHLQTKTAYPFGFFEKGRRFFSPASVGFWVVPKKVPVGHLIDALKARLGESPAARVGSGEDFFSLRPFRRGDDPRQVAWRRSARTGRWMVRENEAVQGTSLLLDLHLPPNLDSDRLEAALAAAGSLAEALLERDHRVGIRAPGLLLAPEGGAGQRDQILLALARLDATEPKPAASQLGLGARIHLVLPGALAPDNSGTVIELSPPPTGRLAAAP
jgi:uncharacterized protein (DUF58 family)